MLSGYMEQLNTRPNLYHTIYEAAHDPTVARTFDEATERCASAFLIDFEKSGRQKRERKCISGGCNCLGGRMATATWFVSDI